MSSGTQVDLDWAGMDAGQGGAPEANGAVSGASPAQPAAATSRMTDEEILGIGPPSPKGDYGGLARPEPSSDARTGSVGAQHGAPLPSAETSSAAVMPGWMQAVAADPKTAGEARQLWEEHQAFRAAFSSAAEARAMKEMLPGGAQEVQALRQIAQEVDSLRAVAQEAETLRQNAASLRESAASVERIDAAIFSGDARAQSEVVAEMARANPAAFRSMFAEAAKVLAGMGAGGKESGGGGQGFGNFDGAITNHMADGPTLRKNGEGWGTQTQIQNQTIAHNLSDGPSIRENGEGWGIRQSYANGRGAVNAGQAGMQNRRQDAGAKSSNAGPGADHEPQITNHKSPGANHQSPVTSHQAATFDPAAYASFERSTNDVVARDVRGSISDTLSRVLPEGVADGAARRIGEDIFNEVHRALAADRSLSEQVGEVLRERRFGSGEQARVASLLAGRAKQLVPSVARRAIGEWTSSVLGTARNKAARQAAAASRVDIAAPGGSMDSMPLRAMSGRGVNYASMSDDEILGV